MLIKNYTIVGYICPYCGVIEKRRLNAFNCSSAKNKILCSKCKKEVVSFEKTKNSSYKLLVNCVECLDRHSFAVKISDFWHTQKKKFECPITGELIFAIGSDENVSILLQDSDNSTSDIPGLDMQERIMVCFEHLEELSSTGRTQCVCGENILEIQIDEKNIHFICPSCGREIEYGFTTDAEIDRILSLPEIYLK